MEFGKQFHSALLPVLLLSRNFVRSVHLIKAEKQKYLKIQETNSSFKCTNIFWILKQTLDFYTWLLLTVVKLTW